MTGSFVLTIISQCANSYVTWFIIAEVFTAWKIQDRAHFYPHALTEQ